MSDYAILRPLTAARPAVRLLREAPVWSGLGAGLWQGRGPRAVFLPSAGRVSSSLLRIYNVAAALKAKGWRTHVLPWKLTLNQRRRCLAGLNPDVVVMQGSRHDLNRPDLYPGQPVVYDVDDADFCLPHLEGAMRAAMGRVDAVIAGSAYVADWCRAAGAGRADVVWTGTPVSARRRIPQAERPPVVAWAQSAPGTYVREYDWVLRVMRDLQALRGDVVLRLYGRRADEDAALMEPFRAAGIVTEWRDVMGYRQYLASFDDVALGLAPICTGTPFSRGKSFGKVLAYVDRKVPVIGSDAGEHGAFFSPRSGVITNDFDRWVTEADRLLSDPRARQDMADAAFAQMQAQLTTEAAATRVDRLLREVVRAAH